MKTKNWYFTFIFFTLTCHYSFSQQQQALYVQESSVLGAHEMFLTASKVQIKGSDTYTIGSTLDDSGSYNILLSKHDASNQLLWSKQFDGSFNGDDYGADVAIDNDGNVYIVGSTQVGINDYNAILIKYNSVGLFLWSQTYGGAANLQDGFNSVSLDASGNIYCVGGAVISTSQLTDVIIRKYNTNGTLIWGNSFNSQYNLQDVAYRVVFSSSNLVVGGASQSSISPISWRLIRLSFNLNSGVLSGAVYTDSDNSELDEISDLIIDSAESIYVCGSKNVSGQGKNLRIIKYNNSLVEQWAYELNGSMNQDDHAFALANIDNLSIAYTGYIHTNEAKKAIIGKLNANTGTSQWTTEWMGTESISCEGYKIVKNLSNDLFVAANTINEFNQDVALIKVSQSNGNVLAHGYFNGESNGLDAVYSMAVNGSNIFIATQTEKGVGFGYALVKWREQTVYLPQNFGTHSSQGYEVNNGQVRNAQGLSDRESKYYNYTSYPSTYLLNNQKMAMVFMKPIDETSISSQRVDMGFKNANTTSDWVPIKLMPNFTNYYLTHMAQPSLKTEMYSGIVWKDIYPNVDLMFTQNELAYKYYFVIRSGANVENIKSEYSGYTSLGVGGDGKLKIGLEWTTEEQESPIAYSMNNSTGVLTQHSWQPSYVVTGNEVAFGNIGAWTGTLVIEINSKLLSSVQLSCPGTNNIEWSTFFGGSGTDVLTGIDIDEEENAFVVGSTSSTFLPQIGLVQILAAQVYNSDFLVAKFDENCAANWATIIGGNSTDVLNGISLSDDGYIHAVGVTYSSNINFFTQGLNDETLNGQRDGFYLKLDQFSGGLEVDTYIGGEGFDYLSGIDISASPDRYVYMVGTTNSELGFDMITSTYGSYSDYMNLQDGIIICVKDEESNQEITWSSYFGTNKDEVLDDVVVDGKDLYVVGRTDETDYGNLYEFPSSSGLFPNFRSPSDYTFNPSVEEYNSFLVHIKRTPGFKSINHTLNYSSLIFNSFGPFTFDYSQLVSLSASKSINNKRNLYLSFARRLGDITDDFPQTGGGWQQVELPQSTLQNQGHIMKIEHDQVPNSFKYIWGSLYGGDGVEGNLNNSISDNGQLSLTGYHRSNTIQSPSDYCENEVIGSFPMCNSDGFFHMETNVDNNEGRSLAALFFPDNQLRWNTQLGCGDHTTGLDIKTNDYRGWIVGYAMTDYTLYDHDGTQNNAYFKAVNSNFRDGVITRYSIPTILGSEEVENTSLDFDFQIYPNPSRDIVNIQLNKDIPVARLRVFNNLGEVVYEQQILNSQLTLKTQEWSSACYLFLIQIEEKTFTRLFIKN